jgi:hypothetical protein
MDNRYIFHQVEEGTAGPLVYGHGRNSFQLRGPPRDINKPGYIQMFGRPFSYRFYAKFQEKTRATLFAMIDANMKNENIGFAMSTGRNRLLDENDTEFGAFAEVYRSFKDFKDLAPRPRGKGSAEYDPRLEATNEIFVQTSSRNRNSTKNRLHLAESLAICLELCAQGRTEAERRSKLIPLFRFIKEYIILTNDVKKQTPTFGHGRHRQWKKLYDIPGVAREVGLHAIDTFQRLESKDLHKMWTYQWAIERALAKVLFRSDVLDSYFHQCYLQARHTMAASCGTPLYPEYVLVEELRPIASKFWSLDGSPLRIRKQDGIWGTSGSSCIVEIGDLIDRNSAKYLTESPFQPSRVLIPAEWPTQVPNESNSCDRTAHAQDESTSTQHSDGVQNESTSTEHRIGVQNETTCTEQTAQVPTDSSHLEQAAHSQNEAVRAVNEQTSVEAKQPFRTNQAIQLSSNDADSETYASIVLEYADSTSDLAEKIERVIEALLDTLIYEFGDLEEIRLFCLHCLKDST